LESALFKRFKLVIYEYSMKLDYPIKS
jgi:hypothetical protein